MVARYGGEAFIALLPETILDGALMAAEAIRAAVISLAIPHSGSKVASHVTLSLGAACTAPQPEALPEAANQELHAAKSGGRNQVKGRMP